MNFSLLRSAIRPIGLVACLSARLVANAAQIDVSADGQPGYKHAIEVPPGAGGLAPKSSIDYTASSANGVVG